MSTASYKILSLTLAVGLISEFSASMAGSSPSVSTSTPDQKKQQKNLPDEWALDMVDAQEAWDLLASKGKLPGQGIVVAHLDTGISQHPELNGVRIWWQAARNFVDESSNVYHRFPGFQFPSHGHGTETLSIMASPRGCPTPAGADAQCVSGIAPQATYLPLLVTDSSIIGTGARIAKAVDYAVNMGAHVITLAMGDFLPMPRLRKALERAHREGVIVIAAAGNGTFYLPIIPAAFPSVIAVAGVTSGLAPWINSTRGSFVDWSAPAAGVTAAFTRKSPWGLTYSVGYAAGTSDATALTAGITALWLSYHGRDELIGRYGKSGLVNIYRELVRREGVIRPKRWPGRSFGPGIINASRVLQAELPPPLPTLLP